MTHCYIHKSKELTEFCPECSEIITQHSLISEDRNPFSCKNGHSLLKERKVTNNFRSFKINKYSNYELLVNTDSKSIFIPFYLMDKQYASNIKNALKILNGEKYKGVAVFNYKHPLSWRKEREKIIETYLRFHPFKKCIDFSKEKNFIDCLLFNIYVHTKNIFVNFNNHLLKIKSGKNENIATNFHNKAYEKWLQEFSNHDFLRHPQKIQEYNRFGFKHSQGFVTYYSECKSTNELNKFLKSIFGTFQIDSVENLLKIRWLIKKLLPVIINNRYQQLCIEESNYNKTLKTRKAEYSVISNKKDLILVVSLE